MSDEVNEIVYELMKARRSLDKSLPEITDQEPAMAAEEARNRLDGVLDKISPVGCRDVPHCPDCGCREFHRETGPEEFISFHGRDANLTNAFGYLCLGCDTRFWVSHNDDE